MISGSCHCNCQLWTYKGALSYVNQMFPMKRCLSHILHPSLGDPRIDCMVLCHTLIPKCSRVFPVNNDMRIVGAEGLSTELGPSLMAHRLDGIDFGRHDIKGAEYPRLWCPSGHTRGNTLLER